MALVPRVQQAPDSVSRGIVDDAGGWRGLDMRDQWTGCHRFQTGDMEGRVNAEHAGQSQMDHHGVNDLLNRKVMNYQ